LALSTKIWPVVRVHLAFALMECKSTLIRPFEPLQQFA